ncbi:MAG: hypothetical protein JWR19_3139 [Pedosphaera sp.]|nr:hypothetical protein [Pedosphaera sp.]
MRPCFNISIKRSSVSLFPEDLIFNMISERLFVLNTSDTRKLYTDIELFQNEFLAGCS